MNEYRLQRQRAQLDEICSKYVYPWLREVGIRFKDFGAYPLCLSDYYTNSMDKQVAEVVSLIIPQEKGDRYILGLYKILGKSPWRKVKNRNFMELADKKSTLGNPFLTNAVLFNMLDWIWEVTCEDKIPLEYAILGELDIIKRHHKTPLANVFEHSDIKYRLEMVLVKMTLRDGYGVGLWQFLPEDELPCPLSPKLRRIMAIFYPIHNGVNNDTISEITEFMGFEKHVDFLYAAWGYQYLQRHEPKATMLFEKKLKRWFKSLDIKYNLNVDIPLESM